MCLKFGGGGVDKVQGGEILKNIYIFNWSKSPPPPPWEGEGSIKKYMAYVAGIVNISVSNLSSS